jgi:hypothetical protein
MARLLFIAVAPMHREFEVGLCRKRGGDRFAAAGAYDAALWLVLLSDLSSFESCLSRPLPVDDCE